MATMKNKGRKTMEIEDFREKFRGCIKNLQFPDDDLGYLPSYVQLLSWFREQKHWNERNTHVAALAVYGWMPTILPQISHKLIDVLNQSDPPSLEKDEKIFNLLNNSYVGTSKLLHMRFPKQIPIWDGRIARLLFSTNCAVSFQRFKNYLECMRSLLKDNTVADEIDKKFKLLNECEKVKDLNIDLLSFSQLRQMELVLFWSAGQSKNQ